MEIVKFDLSIPKNGTDITISGNEIRKWLRHRKFKDDKGAEKMDKTKKPTWNWEIVECV